MATVAKLQQAGNQLVIIYSDGTRAMAYPGPGGLWFVGASSGEVDPGGGGGSTGPAGTVIYPTVVHSVSDSFNDHVARGSVNPGTDYTDPLGDDVHAVAAGVITDVTTTFGGSGGKMVHIDHTALGTGSDYLHLSDNSTVTVGQTVAQGDVIAKSGGSGNGSMTGYGYHLHISYRTVLGHAYTNTNNIDFDAYIKSLV